MIDIDRLDLEGKVNNSILFNLKTVNVDFYKCDKHDQLFPIR